MIKEGVNDNMNENKYKEKLTPREHGGGVQK